MIPGLLMLALSAVPCGAGTLSGTVSVKRGAGQGPIVVYVDGEGPTIEATPPASVMQVNKRFVPPGLVVRAGTTVAFPNRDVEFHEVYSTTPDAAFHLTRYGPDGSKQVSFPRPTTVDVECGIHEEMWMRILVVPNDWVVEVGEDGSFLLPGVEAGTRTVVAWSPEHVQQELEVVVTADGTHFVTFELKRAPLMRRAY